MLFWFVPAGACTRSDRGPVDRTGRYAAVRFGQAIGAREEAHRSRANARERPRPKRVGRLEPCFDRLRFVTSAFRGPAYPTRKRRAVRSCARATSRNGLRRQNAGKARRGAGMAYARSQYRRIRRYEGCGSAGGVVETPLLANTAGHGRTGPYRASERMSVTPRRPTTR